MTSPPPAADTASVTDPGPPPPAPTGMPTRSERFFSWVRGFGVVRIDGWLGGVCAGIAARLRIDPAIVRGIVVVSAVLGVPMFFLYALAWALLPDLRGRIHLQELFRGRWGSAMTGITILALVNLVPVVPWLTNLVFWPLWGTAIGSGYPPVGWDGGRSVLPSWLTTVVGWTTALAVIALIVLLTVRSARRGRTPRADSDPRMASADLAAPGPAEAPSSGDGASADLSDADPLAPPAATTDAVTAVLDASESEPVRPTGPATDADIAAWREQRQAWRAQNDAWRRAQQDAGRAARDEARRERAVAGAVFAAEAEERRRVRRLTAPRTSFAVVAFVLGTALVVGAATALWWSGNGEYAVGLGLFAAALVVGVAMIVAGTLRRRSGFLAFVAIVLLVLGGSATAVATARSMHFGDRHLSNTSSIEGTFVQPWGSLTLELQDTGEDGPPIIIDKRTGYTTITVEPGVELTLSARFGSTRVRLVTYDPDADEYSEATMDQTRQPVGDRYRLETTVTSGDAPVTTRQRVEIDQQDGEISVVITQPRITEEAP